MKIKKAKHGGKRDGAGRKKRFGEKSTTIAMRVPESKAEILLDKFKKIVENQ